MGQILKVIVDAEQIILPNFLKLAKGKDFDFKVLLRDKDDKPVSIVSNTLIRTRFKQADGSNFDLFAPLTAGVDEIQDIVYSAVPDEGSYDLTHENGQTVTIGFADSPATIAGKLNGLKTLSGVVGSGASPTLTMTFAGTDGKRQQTLLTASNITLKAIGVDVTVTITATTKGDSKNGIDVISDICGEFDVVGSESSLITFGSDQDIDFLIRISEKDLNILPLIGILDVSKAI